MSRDGAFPHLNAARAAASLFGVLAGLGGIRHGIGEVLQGNVAPDGLLIDSWAQGPLATNMGGEPAFTLVPNLLATGVLAIIVGTATVVWSASFVQRRHGGLVLMLLSIGSFLVGGGFGPPMIGLLAGVAGLGIHAKHAWWRSHLPMGVRRLLAAAWPWVFAIAALNGLFLFVVSLLLVYGFGLNNPDLFFNSFLFAVVSILLSIVTGMAHDLQRHGEVKPRPI